MTIKRVRVSAPSRLHFGLLSFGHNDERRQFGGIGVALSEPRYELEVVPLEDRKGVTTLGADADRAAMFAERWAAKNRVDLNCEIKIRGAIPSHVGLGSGTQLALSVAAGLAYFSASPATAVADLAASVGRGLRSAVGTYAFDQGGLIVERGKLKSEPLAPLDCRIELPTDWRFVLFRPTEGKGLSGPPESKAFRELPAVPDETTERLQSLIESQIAPAAKSGDFGSFGEGLHEYGMTAGNCFQSWQGGPFANDSVQSLVELLRGWGVAGVGQSSWGPTVFAAVASESDAEKLAARVRDHGPDELASWHSDISAADNAGAIIQVEEESTSG